MRILISSYYHWGHLDDRSRRRRRRRKTQAFLFFNPPLTFPRLPWTPKREEIWLDPKNIPIKHRENLRRYDWTTSLPGDDSIREKRLRLYKNLAVTSSLETAHNTYIQKNTYALMKLLHHHYHHHHHHHLIIIILVVVVVVIIIIIIIIINTYFFLKITTHPRVSIYISIYLYL